MDNETAPQPARRPRLNPFTKAERRQRIIGRLRLGWTYEKIAIEEGVSARRIRQIAADAVRREGLDDTADHALLQLMRLEGAHAAAAEAVNAGDLEAIGPLLRVLERMDRYHQAGARKEVYDDAARKRLFAKLNRVVAQCAAIETRAAQRPAGRAKQPPKDPSEPQTSSTE
jgi:hypothetical protein